MRKPETVPIHVTRTVVQAFNSFFHSAREKFLIQMKLSEKKGFDVWLDYTDFFKDEMNLTRVYQDRVHYFDHCTERLGRRIAHDVLKIINSKGNTI